MIYFDNAATTMPKPPQVAEEIANALNTCGNPSRGSYDASLNGLRTLMKARFAVAKLFNVKNAMDVAFTQNATAALNIAISSVKGNIVTTCAEHNSVLRPVYRHGNFTVVQNDKLGRLDLNKLQDAITSETEAVVTCHASNLVGNVYDIYAIGEICKKKGVKFIADCAQTAGLLAIDMQKANISALCFSGHKSLYGPQGTGGICLGQDFKPQPLVIGGSGSESFSPTHPDLMPDALEAGTQNAHGIAGLLAGITYVEKFNEKIFTGKANKQSNSSSLFDDADILARNFIKQVECIDGVTLYGDVGASVRTPVVALNLDGIDSGDAADMLWQEYGIAVRAGAHCAPLMHKTLGTQRTGAVRFSFSHFNKQEEVDTAVRGIKRILLKRGK